MATAKQITVNFTKEKDTKNTVRFQEVLADGDEVGVIRTLYVRKKELESIGNPTELTVVIKGS